jgi:hypothetical protein
VASVATPPLSFFVVVRHGVSFKKDRRRQNRWSHVAALSALRWVMRHRYRVAQPPDFGGDAVILVSAGTSRSPIRYLPFFASNFVTRTVFLSPTLGEDRETQPEHLVYLRLRLLDGFGVGGIEREDGVPGLDVQDVDGSWSESPYCDQQWSAWRL